MILYLDDADVDTLLPMQDCLRVMDGLFRQESQGLVENRPRQTVPLAEGGGFHRLMMGAAFGFNAVSFKSYASAGRDGANATIWLDPARRQAAPALGSTAHLTLAK